VLATGRPDDILADRDLLIRANLIHEHLHGGPGLVHSHPHAHSTVDAEHLHAS
jgi:hypothetical protein